MIGVCFVSNYVLSSRRSGELQNWPKKENNKGIETFLLYISEFSENLTF